MKERIALVSLLVLLGLSLKADAMEDTQVRATLTSDLGVKFGECPSNITAYIFSDLMPIQEAERLIKQENMQSPAGVAVCQSADFRNLYYHVAVLKYRMVATPDETFAAPQMTPENSVSGPLHYYLEPAAYLKMLQAKKAFYDGLTDRAKSQLGGFNDDSGKPLN